MKPCSTNSRNPLQKMAKYVLNEMAINKKKIHTEIPYSIFKKTKYMYSGLNVCVSRNLDDETLTSDVMVLEMRTFRII